MCEQAFCMDVLYCYGQKGSRCRAVCAGTAASMWLFMSLSALPWVQNRVAQEVVAWDIVVCSGIRVNAYSVWEMHGRFDILFPLMTRISKPSKFHTFRQALTFSTV